jgi:hypothetical protein
MNKKRPMTAAELMAKLQGDPAFRSRETARDRKRQERQDAYDRELAPFLAELNRRGFPGASLNEIVEKHSPFAPSAIEVLLSSLSEISHPRMLESVIRALGAAKEPFDGRQLAACFDAADDEALKWAIANTIALVRPHSIDDWMTHILKNPYWNETFRGLGLEK